jgi:hypothetical protein
MKFETKTKVFALVIITVALLISWAWRSATGGNIPVGKDAVIITGECIVINYDASEDTWDKAKAAWLSRNILVVARAIQKLITKEVLYESMYLLC